MTERVSHHQRRPPDVEEALSSMLWTPYERTPTESSSEDDDERLNKQLCQSHSSHDYRHASPGAFMPLSPTHFGNNDPLPTTLATTAAGDAMLQPTPFVPFSKFFYNNNTARDNSTARTQNHHKNYDSLANHFRFPYPMPNLNKWWSTALNANEPPPYDALYAKAHAYNNPSMEAPAFDAFITSRSAVSSDAKQQLPNGDKSAHHCADSDCFKGRVEHSFADDFIAQIESTSTSIICTNSPKLTTQHVAGPPHKTQRICNNNEITAARVHQPSDDVRQRGSPNCAATERQTQNVQQTNLGSQQSKETNNNYWRNGASPNSNVGADVATDGEDECMSKARDGETTSSAATATATTSQVNQPVSSINPCSTSANMRGNANIEAAATATNRLDRCTNATATPALNTIANLLTLVRDKAAITTVVRDNNSNDKSHKATTERNASSAVVHSFKRCEPTIIQSTTSSISSRTTERAALEVVVVPLAAPSSSSSCTPTHLWRKARLKQSRTHFESSRVASVGIAPVPAHCKSLVDTNANSINVLTPNKCLAELERLYAEFRASESALAVARDSNCGCASSDADGLVSNMRVNIPATASDLSPAIVRQENQVLTTSSVFLTSTNSVTTNCSTGGNIGNTLDNLNNNIDSSVSNDGRDHTAVSDKGSGNSNSVAVLATDSRLCQPSLTIKVNDDDNNNREDPTSFSKLQSRFNVVLHQPVGSNNVSVSVVNCNYSGNEVNDDNYNDSRTNKCVIGNVRPTATLSASSNASVNSSCSCPVPKVSCSGSGSGNDVAKNILNHNNNNENKAAAVVVDSSVHIISVSDRPSACVTTSSASPRTVDSQPTTRSRTFTSTECQTDEIPSVQLRANRVSSPTATNREQRRRERRERRHQQLHNQPSSNSLQLQFSHRRLNVDRHSLPAPPPVTLLHPQHMHHPAAQTATMPAALSAMLRPMLPDLLHSHFPPPYSALPLSGGACSGGGPIPPIPPLGCPPPLPPPPGTTLVTSVISTVPMPGGPVASDGRFTLPLPIIRRSPSERSGKGCCGQWFAGPPLRALIAVVALGGVACALGGAALGATGLAGPPSSHLTAALLMIGVGVVLVTVSGAAWRLTAPGGPPCLGLGSNADLGRCGRRPCGRGSGTPHGLLYPEFQHRPPPPSYQASMQEYRLRLLLLDRDRQNGAGRGNSPPPTYRSHLGSLLRAPLTTTIRGAGSSSIGGTSEYSLPPSYRSRNPTPATGCSDRSIETAPSGRLLANEDLPEPASIEQLRDYSSLQPRPPSASRSTILGAKKSPAADVAKLAPNQISDTQLRNAAIAEAKSSPIVGFCGNAAESNRHSVKDKLHPRVFGSDCTSVGGSNQELVTIVTITKTHGQDDAEPCSTNSTEPIEVLAHL